MIEWRPVPGTRYLASSDGQIRHCDSEVPRKQTRSGDYLQVSLRHNRRHWVMSVHCMVAAAFKGPRPEGAQVRHLDGNGLNNAEANLEYGSPVENMSDRDRHGTTARGQRNGNSKITDQDADFIRLIYARKLASQGGLAALFKISQAQVHNLVRGKQRRLAA